MVFDDIHTGVEAAPYLAPTPTELPLLSSSNEARVLRVRQTRQGAQRARRNRRCRMGSSSAERGRPVRESYGEGVEEHSRTLRAYGVAIDVAEGDRELLPSIFTIH